MPSNLETLHGDEELIETCSLRFFEALEPHIRDGGEVDLKAAGPDIERTSKELAAHLGLELIPVGVDGHTVSEDGPLHPLIAGFLDAARTHRDTSIFMDYL